MEYQKLCIEKQERICVLKINHPEALNALNTLVLQELDRAMDAIARDAGIDVVILTGEERAFVAGADISEMSAMNAAGVLGNWELPYSGRSNCCPNR